MRAAGYRYVALDLEGFRSGNLNRVLAGRAVGVVGADGAPTRRCAVIQVRVKLTFPESLVRVPVLARMVRQFDVEPNIRRANVEEHQGWIICELDGEPAAVEAALAWLRAEGVQVDLLGDVLES